MTLTRRDWALIILLFPFSLIWLWHKYDTEVKE